MTTSRELTYPLFAMHAGDLAEAIASGDGAILYERWDEIQAFKEWLAEEDYSWDLIVAGDDLAGLAELAWFLVDPAGHEANAGGEPALVTEHGEGYIPDWDVVFAGILARVKKLEEG